jgi:hypothetical protein
VDHAGGDDEALGHGPLAVNAEDVEVLADVELAFGAAGAAAAGDDDVHHHGVAGGQAGDVRRGLEDDAGGLVAEDGGVADAVLHGAEVDVKVGAADADGLDGDGDVAGPQRRVGHLADDEALAGFEDGGFHWLTSGREEDGTTDGHR